MTKKQILLATAIILANPFAKVKGQNTDSIVLGNIPRDKQSYDKPGHYEMVAFLDKSEINPGDTINVNLYFSGYGQISLSKAYFKSNKNIFQDTACYVSGGLGGNLSSRHFSWNAIKDKIDAYRGGVIPMVGIRKINSPEWGTSTPYLDLVTDTNNTSILTEFPLDDHPPYYFHLTTRSDIEDGPYSITVVYSYFNGQEWIGQQQQMNFKVKNVIERNPGWTWLIGIVGILLALIAIIPIVSELSEKIVDHLFKRKSALFKPSTSASGLASRSTPSSNSSKKLKSGFSKTKGRNKFP